MDDIVHVVKRGRGRPRKRPAAAIESDDEVQLATPGPLTSQRECGRPRKVPRLGPQPTSTAIAIAEDTAEIPTKRGPGRPRKRALPRPNFDGLASHAEGGMPEVKRGRGRPRKMPRLDLRPIPGAAATVDDVAEIPIKRGPGRPKKRGLPSPEREGGNLASHADSGLPEAKRGRGRPRKVPRIDLRPTSGAATTAGDNAEVSIQRGPGRPRKRALPSAESEGGDLATHADHGLPAGAKRGRGRPRKNPDVQARSSAHVPHGSVDAGPSRVPPREELGKQAGAIAGRDVEGVTPHAEGTSSIGPSGSAAAADGANGIPEVQIKREPEDSTSAVLMTGPGAAVEGVKRRCGRPPGSKNKRQPILTASSTEGTQTPFKVEPTTPSEGCALLRLPAELRLRIYEFMYPTYLHCNISMYQDGTLFRTGDIWHEAKLMLSDGHTRMQQNLQYSRADEGSADRPNALPILLTPLYLTCRTLCYEVLPHLYDQTVFHFSLRGIPSPFNHAVHSSAQSLRLRSKPCQRCRRPTPTLNAQRRPAANLCSLCTRHGGWPDVRLLGSISTWPPVQQIVHWDLQLTSLDHEYPNRPKFNAAAWRASEEMHSAVLEAWMQPGRDYRAPRTFTYSVKLGRVWNIIDLLELRDFLRRPKVIEEAGQDGASEALTRVRKMHREVERRCFTKIDEQMRALQQRPRFALKVWTSVVFGKGKRHGSVSTSGEWSTLLNGYW